MATYAVDWDDTLVDMATQQWLDGARDALANWLTVGHRIIIHSARANFPEGRQQILDGIRAAHLDHPNLTVEPKPLADAYVDNLGVRFTGDWQQTEADVANGTSAKPVPQPRTVTTAPRLRPSVYAVGNAPTARPTFGIRRT